MKERNVLKRFSNGWIMGIDDENELRLESPTGEVGYPVSLSRETASKNGSPDAQLGLPMNGEEGLIMVPTCVAAEVMVAARKLATVQAQEAMRDDDEEDEPTEEAPTLHDLGFDDNPRVI